jgi:ribA/ribD-fused uncharacterized protein
MFTETDDMIIFFGYHELSNWHTCIFESDGFKYCTSEQYYMSQKALCFGDFRACDAIMSTNDPKLMKKYGRQIKDFDQDVWDKYKQTVMFNAVYLKFSTIPRLKQYLISTGSKYLAEGSIHDKIWGTGMDIKCTDHTKWTGSNLLGAILMQVRQILMSDC